MITLATLFIAGSPAIAATPTASSYATTSEGVKHPPSHAFDGMLSTAWAEGDIGSGEGSWIEVRFDRPTDIHSVSIWPGFLASVDRDIRLHARPRAVTLTFKVSGGEDVVEQDVLVDPGAAQRPLRHDIKVEVPKARSMRLTVDDVYPGGIYSDMYISEIAFDLVGGDTPAPVQATRDWVASATGERADQAHRTKVIGLYNTFKSADFGDRDTLRVLMDWATDGAPYLRQRVASRVPHGFRLNALTPDKHAVEALLKIKDANAAASLQRAALRTTGSIADQLERSARMLTAYAQVQGGGRRNIDPWGEPGFEPGALQSFGEPLALSVDEYGGLYVADTGNHRVQRFSVDNGAFETSFGVPAAGMTDFWFHKRREAYASGAEPSTGPAGFVLPVDVEVVPGNKGDTVYVLDYARDPDSAGPYGRITEILPSGAIGHQQMLPFDSPISARAGGEGHLIATKKRVTVVWADQGVSYTTKQWEEGEVFDLEDGSARGAIGLSRGRLGLIYGTDLVMYNPDGFRYGVVMGEDTLGTGYEDWDIAYDEKKKMWVVLDTGEVIKLKRLGKVDYRFRLSEKALATPRIDAFQDVVFVTSGDRILTGDALQLHAEQTAEGDQGGTLDLGDPE